MRQQYHDRFFVPTATSFIPLFEDSIRGSRKEDGRWIFGSKSGSRSRHAQECYEVVGFDYRKLMGFGLAIDQIKPSSLAAELAFVSQLSALSLNLRDEALSSSRGAEELLRQFGEEHLMSWMEKAAAIMDELDRDFYSAVVGFASGSLRRIL